MALKLKASFFRRFVSKKYIATFLVVISLVAVGIGLFEGSLKIPISRVESWRLVSWPEIVDNLESFFDQNYVLEATSQAVETNSEEILSKSISDREKIVQLVESVDILRRDKQASWGIVENLKRKEKRLLREIESFLDTIELQKREIGKLTQDIERFLERESKIMTEKESLKRDLVKLKILLDETEKSNQTSQQIANQSIEATAQIRSQLFELESKYSRVKSENSRYQRMVESQKKTINHLDRQLVKLQSPLEDGKYWTEPSKIKLDPPKIENAYANMLNEVDLKPQEESLGDVVAESSLGSDKSLWETSVVEQVEEPTPPLYSGDQKRVSLEKKTFSSSLFLKEMAVDLKKSKFPVHYDHDRNCIVIDVGSEFGFEYGSAQITAGSQKLLNKFFVQFLSSLSTRGQSHLVNSISITGHASPTYRKSFVSPKKKSTKSFKFNVQLSQQRAVSIKSFVEKNFQREFPKLVSLLVAVGKGYADPIIYTMKSKKRDRCGEVYDCRLSRRVEIGMTTIKPPAQTTNLPNPSKKG